MSKRATSEAIAERTAILRIAAEALVHPRTAARAVQHGPLAIRGLVVRDRIERAAEALGIALGPPDRLSTRPELVVIEGGACGGDSGEGAS